ncbi:hypothetical protein Palpr_0141 [Paludibacter propionicigenes WB4]|uniref:Uncharacterized protein n=1 Tax=Paludibacter propionicigenes (strain DSM 17365 / JCM 13257 / WB4) TaxID=694427 RepID=E4T0E4_PALPW|nr:RES domain-containing protein [Paludibacter propionicigenes]ADQ78303.1 hypothetical protein Palpr_0141 [Paludibacter propionicigenes WB4]
MDDNIFSVEDYIKEIEKLKKIENLPSEELKSVLLEHSKNSFPILFRPICINNTSYWRLTESRHYMNIGLISEFSYPPSALTKFGRANIPYHPVFYCSESPTTPFFEMVNEDDFKDKVYYLSKWIVRGNKEVKLATFTFAKNMPENSDSESHFVSFDKFKDLFSENENLQRKAYDAFVYLSECFVKEQHYVTSFIGYDHLYGMNEYSADMLLYPSIRTDNNKLNFAIHPNFVLQEMELEYVIQLNVKKLHKLDFSIEFEILNVGFNNNGFLSWQSFKKIPESIQNKIHNDLKYTTL